MNALDISDADNREAIRMLRGAVIRVLYRKLESKMGATAEYLARICRVLDGRPAPRHWMAEALSYLVLGGYVEEGNGGVDLASSIAVYLLTAKGMQLFERVIEDHSIVMD